MHTTYIISQIFMFLFYVAYGGTFHAKSRTLIIILNSTGQVTLIIAFFLMNAYAGMVMAMVSLFRNGSYYILGNKNAANPNYDPTKISKGEFFIFGLIAIFTIFAAIFTYTSPFSLLSIIATIFYSFAILQKNIKFYRFAGIPTAVIWLVYYAYIQNIVGVICHTILIIFITYKYLQIKKEEEQER